MIRYSALLTAILLVTVSCSVDSGLEAGHALAPVAEPTLTDTNATLLPTAVSISVVPSPFLETSVECTLDEIQRSVGCVASGYPNGSQLTWTSTVSSANYRGSEWQFNIGSGEIGDMEQVFLEICQRSTCQTIETSIDTSPLVQTKSSTAASGPTRISSSVPRVIAKQTPLRKPLGTSEKMLPPSSAKPRKPERILILPFTVDHEPQGIIPMGETILHPPPHNPVGHPGIDFQWPYKAPMVIALTGEIGEIRENEKHGTTMMFHSVSVITDEYIVTYNVIDLYSVNPSIVVGSQVVAGQVLGHAIPVSTEDTWHSTHWEFGVYTKIPDPKPNREGITLLYKTERLCPLSYFIQSEEERLIRLWAVAKYDDRDQFPDLCNAYYKNS